MTNLSIEDLRAANLRDRRERIATAALQGLLSNPQTKGWDHEIAARAVRYADALIAELNERENGR